MVASSSGSAIAAIWVAMSLPGAPPRTPCWKLCTCRARYQLGRPASFGALSAWLPSACRPWQAEQTANVAWPATRSAAGRACQLRECPLAGEPGLVGVGLVDDDPAAHGEVPHAAQFLAQDLELAGPGGRQPQVGDHARHHVHLHAELRHGEIVQDVLGPQQHLDRLVERQVQLGPGDQHVVLAARIVGVHAERVVGTDERGIDGTEYAVLAPAGGSSTTTAGRRPRPRPRHPARSRTSPRRRGLAPAWPRRRPTSARSATTRVSCTRARIPPGVPGPCDAGSGRSRRP